MPGQAHNLRGTTPLLEGLFCGQLLADEAFDADWLRENARKAGIESVIPPKSNRRSPAKFDEHAYRWSPLVKNFFGKLKKFRCVAMMCCKTDQSFKTFIVLATTPVKLR